MAYKKITSHVSISIPVAMRRELGIEPKDPMEIKVQNGQIVISPYMLRCNFCRSATDVQEFCGRGICKTCARKILQHLK